MPPGSRCARGPDVVDDVKQLLRVQLLVAKDGKPPGLAGYRGKGPLRGWVRITATRELIRQKKKVSREMPLEPDRALDAALGGHVDPALDALKAEYRTEFAERAPRRDRRPRRRGPHAAAPADRRDLSIDEVGAAFGVHRATAARWLIARTRRARRRDAQAARRPAPVPVEEIDSVIRLVSSQLEASVVRFLRER